MAQLAAAALLTILVATLSGMSKAEVERIWLPFTIWVVALPALLPGSGGIALPSFRRSHWPCAYNNWC